jgi:SAM-dependent methyltransferase
MQKNIWEKEYKNPKLVTGGNEPQTSVKDFLRWLRRESGGVKDGQKLGLALENLRVLDLGCGSGKNANYIASLDSGNHVVGVDISETALTQARAARDKLIAEGKLNKGQVEYAHANIGEPLKFSDSSLDSSGGKSSSSSSFDLALDVTSSNSLSESERTVYLAEVHRLLKPGGWFFIRALCKDGDKNAQSLLKLHPGTEKDTYIMPEMGLNERVFSKKDFIETYSPQHPHSPLFEIVNLEKETHYSQFAGRSYKRNFWVAYERKLQQ